MVPSFHGRAIALADSSRGVSRPRPETFHPSALRLLSAAVARGQRQKSACGRGRPRPVGASWKVASVKIYVAGPLADVATVRAVQSTVAAAGHELTLDWTEDASLVEDYGSQLDVSGKLAQDELDAVIAADAVLVIASEHDGRGMFVELGAALARAQQGDLAHVVVVGEIRHESVFYFHPAVQRVASIREWLDRIL